MLSENLLATHCQLKNQAKALQLRIGPAIAILDGWLSGNLPVLAGWHLRPDCK
jgi:hypothetical protein